MKIDVTLGSTLAQNVLSAIQAGSGSNPSMELYDGTEPSSMGGAITDNLLAVFDLGGTVGSESNGEITFSGWSNEDAAPNGGTAGWARLLDADGNEVMYLGATGPSGSGPVTVNPQTIEVGKPVNLTSAVIRMPV